MYTVVMLRVPVEKVLELVEKLPKHQQIRVREFIDASLTETLERWRTTDISVPEFTPGPIPAAVREFFVSMFATVRASARSNAPSLLADPDRFSSLMHAWWEVFGDHEIQMAVIVSAAAEEKNTRLRQALQFYSQTMRSQELGANFKLMRGRTDGRYRFDGSYIGTTVKWSISKLQLDSVQP